MCILCRWLKLTVSGTCWRHSRPSRLRVTCHSIPTAVFWSQTRWTTASFCWTATWNNRPSSSTLTPMLRCGGQWDCASMNPHYSSTWPTKRSHPPSTLSQYSGYPEQLVHRRSLLHEKSHPPRHPFFLASASHVKYPVMQMTPDYWVCECYCCFVVVLEFVFLWIVTFNILFTTTDSIYHLSPFHVTLECSV